MATMSDVRRAVSRMKSSVYGSSSKSSSKRRSSSRRRSSRSSARNKLAEIRKRTEALKERIANRKTSTQTKKEPSTGYSSDDLSASEKIAEVRERIEKLKPRVEALKEETPEEEIIEVEEEIMDIEAEEIIPMEDVKIGGIMFSVPEDMVDSPFFKSMDDNYKAIAANMWKKVFDEGHSINNFISAMEVAAEQSDAYMASQIRIFEDEIARSFTELGEDLEAQERLYGLRKKQIKEDLERYEDFSHTKIGRLYANLDEQERLAAIQSGRIQKDVAMKVGDLTLDQQRDMKTISDEYDVRIETTRSSMASRGLARSSIRGRAEERLEESREDIIESTNTKYEREQRNIMIEAERREEDIKNEIQRIKVQTGQSEEDIRRQLGEKRIETKRGVEDLGISMQQFEKQISKSATDVLRKGEKYFGSEKMTQMLPNLGIRTGVGDWMPADWMVGDIGGQQKTDWTTDWSQRLKGMLGT